MDPRKTASEPTPRDKKIKAVAEKLGTTGYAVVAASKDIDARQLLYEAAKEADVVVTTVKIGPGLIEGHAPQARARSEDYFESAVA